MEKGRISGRQLMYLVIILIFSTGVMFLPSISGAYAKQDTWIASLLATGFGVMYAVLLGALVRRFPRKSPFEYSVRLLGPVLGRLVTLALVGFAFHTGAIVAREFGELLISSLMPETPLSVFIIIQVWMACMAARNGIEVIARVNEFWTPILVGTAALIIALLIKDAEWPALLPVLDRGWESVLRGSIPPVAWMGEPVVLLYALAGLNQPGEATRALVKGIASTGLLMTGGVLITIVVFGPERMDSFLFPALRLARMVDVARFVTRIESLIILLWLVGTLVKTAIFLHVSAAGLADVLGLADYVPLVLPLGALMVSVSIAMFPDLSSMTAFLAGPWPKWALMVELTIPLLLLLTALLRGLPRQRSGAQTTARGGDR